MVVFIRTSTVSRRAAALSEELQTGLETSVMGQVVSIDIRNALTWWNGVTHFKLRRIGLSPIPAGDGADVSEQTQCQIPFKQRHDHICSQQR